MSNGDGNVNGRQKCSGSKPRHQRQTFNIRPADGGDCHGDRESENLSVSVARCKAFDELLPDIAISFLMKVSFILGLLQRICPNGLCVGFRQHVPCRPGLIFYAVELPIKRWPRSVGPLI